MVPGGAVPADVGPSATCCAGVGWAHAGGGPRGSRKGEPFLSIFRSILLATVVAALAACGTTVSRDYQLDPLEGVIFVPVAR